MVEDDAAVKAKTAGRLEGIDLREGQEKRDRVEAGRAGRGEWEDHVTELEKKGKGERRT